MTSAATIADEIGAEAPHLPTGRGPLSELVVDALGASAASYDGGLSPDSLDLPGEPLGDDDLQLALYCCYELHYRSFAGVDASWEWDPRLLAVRRELERSFLQALELAVPPRAVAPAALGSLLFEIEAADEAPSLSRRLERSGELWQFREFAAHRSAYQLKEADPHTWAIPRLAGVPKAALIEVQADEYGGGRVDRMHSELFATTMRALGLDERYGAYLELLPGETLSTVNLMSMCGLHRELRGALVGHLAMFEMTSSQPNRRYANGLRRLGLGPAATGFYDEHVEADAVHENIAAYDLAEGLARREPRLASQIVFGAECLLRLDALLAEHLIACWDRGDTSLREPLPSLGGNRP